MSQVAFEYVDSPSALDKVCTILSGASRASIDTEANSLHNYFERVCLIQLTVDDEHFIIDPLSEIDLAPFLSLLTAKDIILHGSDYDLRLMRSTFDFTPKGQVFDTMLAAQMLGMERIGYAALVEEYFDVKLSKAGQKSNWGQRPLTESQLKYAVDDTRYLGELADLLREELESRGRHEWHEEWCNKVLEATQQESERDTEDAWRIRGMGLLERRELAYVREIWHWRDKEAQRVDRPPFKILGNHQLIELAHWASKHPEAELSKGPKLPRTCDGRRLEALKRAIAKATRMPRSKWPERRKKRTGNSVNHDYRAQVEAMRDACSEIAEQLDVPAPVLAPKSILTAIARNNATTAKEMKACSGMMDWQAELLAEPIREVLSKL